MIVFVVDFYAQTNTETAKGACEDNVFERGKVILSRRNPNNFSRKWTLAGPQGNTPGFDALAGAQARSSRGGCFFYSRWEDHLTGLPFRVICAVLILGTVRSSRNNFELSVPPPIPFSRSDRMFSRMYTKAWMPPQNRMRKLH